jgi:polyisoprenoid-binding protein YceI
MPGSRRRAPRRPRRWVWWLAGAAAAIVVLVVGGTFVYIHFVNGPAPAPLGLKSTSGPSSTPSAGVSDTASLGGTWDITTGSVVGYRVKEVLMGQDTTAVGRTRSITGHLTISGATVTAAGFTVQMATIKSNESQRDVQFRGRIMDTSAYPTGTLALTKPISLGTLPAVGVVKTYTATANLVLHGQTRASARPARSSCRDRSRSCSHTGTSRTRASPAS